MEIKARELRLNEVLRWISTPPEAIFDRRTLEGRISREFHVSWSGARNYIEDLQIRGWISVIYGKVRILQAGQKRIAQSRLPEGP